MKKNYSVKFSIEPRSGKGKKSTHTMDFFAENAMRAEQLANYFKYVMHDRKKYKVTTLKVTKLK